MIQNEFNFQELEEIPPGFPPGTGPKTGGDKDDDVKEEK